MKKNFIYQIIYRVLTVITPLVTAPILSRALGAENLGIYSATLAFVSYFTMLTLLGIETYGNRTVAAVNQNREKRQEYFWNIYAVQFTAGMIAILAYTVSIFFMQPERQLISVFQGIWILSSLLDINWFFFGCEEFRLTVTKNIFVKILTVSGVALFVKTPQDLIFYTILMAASMAISQSFLWISLRKFISFEKPKWHLVKQHIKPILKLFIPVLAMTVFHVMDKTMLDILSNEQSVGYYYSADKIINIPIGVVVAVGTVMLPRVTNVLHNGSIESARALLKKSTELVFFLICIVGFGIGAIADKFVPVFFGPGYDPCIVVIWIFVPVLFIKALSDLTRTQYLIPAGKDRTYITAVICGAVANVISNYLLIPMYQERGAVYGTLIAEFVVLVIQMWTAQKEVPFLRYFVSQWYYVVFGLAMFGAVRIAARLVHFSDIWNVTIMIGVGGCVYLILCLITWEFKKTSIFYGWRKNIKRKFRRKIKEN